MALFFFLFLLTGLVFLWVLTEILPGGQWLLSLVRLPIGFVCVCRLWCLRKTTITLKLVFYHLALSLKPYLPLLINRFVLSAGVVSVVWCVCFWGVCCLVSFCLTELQFMNDLCMGSIVNIFLQGVYWTQWFRLRFWLINGHDLKHKKLKTMTVCFAVCWSFAVISQLWIQSRVLSYFHSHKSLRTWVKIISRQPKMVGLCASMVMSHGLVMGHGPRAP